MLGLSVLRRSRALRWPLAVLALTLVALSGGMARAQVADLDLRSTIFLEPSPDSDMTVITPAANLAVTPAEWITLNAGWEADIVTGATESVKAGSIQPNPDIVTQASITDFRSVVNGGFTINRKQTTFSGNYAYGNESDYESHSFSVAAGADFFQRNTQLLFSYSRAFDKVCNQGYEDSLSPTLRLPLDSSQGCFSANADNRRTDDIDQDNFQGGWTQAWTPVFTTQLVLTGSIQNGFLGNPYRAVVIGPTGEFAQENHPENRMRGAASLRARLYIKPIETAFGLGGRLYRDSWDITSGTVEAEAERYLLEWLRLRIRGRYYKQTEAIFWSDDYTGGEPRFGPRGQYWSGDRELSPLSSVMFGGRVVAAWQGQKGDRIGGMFLELRAGGGVDMIITDLEDFTWAGQTPNDTTALVTQVSVSALF